MTAVIEIRSLCKRFGELVAVDGIDLDIEEGEIFGLLGPNGAGKTTTIRIICGLSHPTDGSVSVIGLDSSRSSKEVRRVIGVVPQGNVLDRDLSVRQNLAYHSKLYGIERSEYDGRIESVLGLMGMADRIDSPPLTLSGGMKRRVTIAKALVHQPKILVLDEPTTGLDPQARLVVWERIRRLKDEGITVLLTTHYMEEADYLCDRVAIIDRGRVVAQGEPTRLKDEYARGDIFELVLSAPTDLRAIEEEGLGEVMDSFDGHARVVSKERKAAMKFLLDRYGDVITNINVRPSTLEDVFLEITGKEIRDDGSSCGARSMKIN